MTRDIMIGVRVNAQENRDLTALAKQLGRKKPDVLRHLLNCAVHDFLIENHDLSKEVPTIPQNPPPIGSQRSQEPPVQVLTIDTHRIPNPHAR